MFKEKVQHTIHTLSFNFHFSTELVFVAYNLETLMIVPIVINNELMEFIACYCN